MLSTEAWSQHQKPRVRALHRSQLGHDIAMDAAAVVDAP